MKFTRSVASVIAIALMSVGASAAHAETVATPQPMAVISPAAGATIASTYPKFSWALPAGAQTEKLVVTTSPKTVDGLLPDSGKTFYKTEDVGGPASSIKSTYVYSPDTYYWQVTAQDLETGAPYVSPVQKFVVPTVFVLTKLKAKVAKNPGNNINEVVVNGVLKCSVAYYSKHNTLLTIQVFKGKKKIGEQERDAGDCNSMTKTKEFANWQPQPGSIKKGTKLTVKVFASFGKAKSDVTVLKVTWK
jgi:hypothetical protein